MLGKRSCGLPKDVNLLEPAGDLIEEAKRLLEASDRAVDEICFEIGYEDPSFFRRLFKRRTGVAPGRYRRVFQPIHHATPAGR